MKKYPELAETSLPAAFIEINGSILELITSLGINKQQNLSELENLVLSKLK